MKENKGLFWEHWSSRFNLPIPRLPEKRATYNVSPVDKNVYLLSQINGICSKIFETLINSKDYKQFVKLASLTPEWESLNKSYLDTNKWTHRRFIEYADESQIDEIYQMLNISPPSNDFFDLTLSSDLTSAIKNNFIGFLKKEELIEAKYIDGYELNLENDLKQTP